MKRFLMIVIAIMATTLADATAASAPAGAGGERSRAPTTCGAKT